VLTGLGLVLLALLAGLGRLERARWIDGERARMNHVLALLGPSFLVRTLTDFWDEREGTRVKCLRYWYGEDPYAMQVCFDPRGRLVETYDERSGKIDIANLRVEPEESGVVLPPQELDRIRLLIMRQAELARRAQVKRECDALRRAGEPTPRARCP